MSKEQRLFEQLVEEIQAKLETQSQTQEALKVFLYFLNVLVLFTLHSRMLHGPWDGSGNQNSFSKARPAK